MQHGINGIRYQYQDPSRNSIQTQTKIQKGTRNNTNNSNNSNRVGIGHSNRIPGYPLPTYIPTYQQQPRTQTQTYEHPHSHPHRYGQVQLLQMVASMRFGIVRMPIAQQKL